MKIIMENFFNFLSDNSIGILMLILILYSSIFAINWIAKIFNLGKYKNLTIKEGSYENLGYIATQFFVNLINDFKHFLALLIVLIFTVLIIYSMTTSDTFDQKMEALQLVIASLGGLVGTVIGYYFGESAARSNNSNISTNTASTQYSDLESIQLESGIEPAPQFNDSNNK